LRLKQPLVALESTVITHGLPYPQNLQLAEDMEAEVRQQGSVPATIAIVQGKVVIGADIGGIPELIEHGQTGYLFESGNVDQLAMLLSAVDSMSNPKLTELGRQARQHVATKFTIERYSHAMLTLYSSLGVPTQQIRANNHQCT